MIIKFRLYLILLWLLFIPSANSMQLLDEIRDTAAVIALDICGEHVKYEGTTKKISAGIQGRIEFNSLFYKLLDLFISADSSIDTTEFKGILQKHLADLDKYKIACRYSIFKDTMNFSMNNLDNTKNFDQNDEVYEAAMKGADYYFDDKQIDISKYFLFKAADHSNSYAEATLGHIYYYGYMEKYGKSKADLNNAIYWYKKAAAQENLHAIETLGHIYYYGYKEKGDDPDITKALHWLKKGKKKGGQFSETTLEIINRELLNNN